MSRYVDIAGVYRENGRYFCSTCQHPIGAHLPEGGCACVGNVYAFATDDGKCLCTKSLKVFKPLGGKDAKQ